MKVKNKNIILILTMFMIIILGGKVEASDRLHLNNLHFDAKINNDGSMDVVEVWDINIKDTNTLYKTFKIDMARYSGIENVSVLDITNGDSQELFKTNMWKYHLDKNSYFGGINNDNKYEIAWGVGLDNGRDTRKYEISYKVIDAVSKNLDYAELYWQFIGSDFEIRATNVTGTIVLPENAVNKEDIKVWGHTEDLNGEINVTSKNQIDFKIFGFNTGRFVEIRTLFPSYMIKTSGRMENREILNSVIQEETVWVNEANARREGRKFMRIIAVIGINMLCLVFGIFIIISIKVNYKKFKKMKKHEPTQDFIYFREIPRKDSTPAQAFNMYHKLLSGSGDIGKIFSATLLHLNLKKIIEIEAKKDEKGKEDFVIKIVKENPAELNENIDEKVILEFLKKACKNTNQINMKELKKYISESESKVEKLKDSIDKNTVDMIYNKNLANKKEKEENDKYILKIIGFVIVLVFSIFVLFSGIYGFKIPLISIGIIPFILVIIIKIILLGKIASKINVFTQKGIDEHVKWKGLKKYMKEFSMLSQKDIPDIILWEEFLVYATVFGIAEKVLKQLKIVYPNITNEVYMNNYTYMYLMMNTNFTSTFSNAISTTMSSSYSSSTGGGGGFSGGGGRRSEDGGGGGGR